MRVSPSISYQAWILVLVPLIFQLVFISVLVNLLNQVEIERAQEAHAREMEAQLTVLLRLLLADGNACVVAQLTKGTTALAVTHIDTQKAHAGVDMLRELTSTDPHLHKAFSDVELDYKQFRQSLIDINGHLKQGNSLAAVAEAVKLKRYLNKMFVVLNQMLSEQQRVQQEGKQAQADYRKRVKMLLVYGMLLNIFVAVTLTLYFNRGVSRRLKALMDNTVRLARGQELNPKIGGEDEIGQLDDVFRRMAASLDEMTRRERKVVETAADVICTIDAEGNLTAANPALKRICGYDADELIERPFTQIVSGNDIDRTVAALRQIMSKKSEASFDNQLKHADGSVIDMSWSARWSQEEGALFCVGRDVTGRKELERLKRDFVAMVSHDLRTPITSLKMFLDLVSANAYGELSDSDRQDLASTQESIEQLTALVNNVLDMEKIDSGRLELHLEMMPLDAVLKRALELVAPLARARSIALDGAASNNEPVSIDNERMARAISILLANAIKLSPPGSTVSLQVESEPQWIKVAVIDQAEAIPDQLSEVVFDRFAHVGSTGPWQDAATRIGLAICRAILENHGGKVGVQGCNNGGNKFWLMIPKAVARSNIGDDN